jgi:hypothetical protein
MRRRAAAGLLLAGVVVLHGWALAGLERPPRPRERSPQAALQVRQLELLKPVQAGGRLPLPALLPLPEGLMAAVRARRSDAGGPGHLARTAMRPAAEPLAAMTPAALLPVALPGAPGARPADASAAPPEALPETSQAPREAQAAASPQLQLQAAAAEPPHPAAPEAGPSRAVVAVDPAKSRPEPAAREVQTRPPVAAPAYATRIAAPYQARFRMRRGMLSGEAKLEWRHDGSQYQARLEADAMLVGTVLTQQSVGGFDASGLAPQRFVERRWRRGERAVNFVRPADGQRPRITFSAQSGEAPWVAGVQDRLSWMMQLSAVAAAWPGGGPKVGDSIALEVAGPAGEVQHWVFSVTEVPGTGSTALKLVREPGGQYETAVQVWLDASRHFQPRRVRLLESRGDPLELTRMEPNGSS